MLLTVHVVATSLFGSSPLVVLNDYDDDDAETIGIAIDTIIMLAFIVRRRRRCPDE
jgi:hypothetical protein